MSMSVSFHLRAEEPVYTKVEHTTTERGLSYTCFDIVQAGHGITFFCTPKQALEIGQQIAAQAEAILAAEKVEEESNEQ